MTEGDKEKDGEEPERKRACLPSLDRGAPSPLLPEVLDLGESAREDDKMTTRDGDETDAEEENDTDDEDYEDETDSESEDDDDEDDSMMEDGKNHNRVCTEIDVVLAAVEEECDFDQIPPDWRGALLGATARACSKLLEVRWPESGVSKVAFTSSGRDIGGVVVARER